MLKELFQTVIDRNSLPVVSQYKKDLINAKVRSNTSNGGFPVLVHSLYNFLNTGINIVEVIDWDYFTGIEIETYTKNSDDFLELLNDSMTMTTEQYISFYKTIPEYFTKEKKFISYWYANPEITNDILNVVKKLTEYHICVELLQKFGDDKNGLETKDSDYQSVIKIVTDMDRQFPGVTSFVFSREFVYIVNETINIIMALLEVKLRSLGGEKF